MGVVIVASLFLSAAGAMTVQGAFGQNTPSASPGASIKVTGEAFKILDADQATITLTSETQPTDISKIMDLYAWQSKVIESITNAVGDESTTVRIASSYLYPRYSGPSIPSNTFTGFSSIAISSNVDQFTALSEELYDEGFGLESISVSQVPERKEGMIDANVIIPLGANKQNSLPYEPKGIVVASGSTVMWTNLDIALHTATSGSASSNDSGKIFDTGFLAPGDSAAIQINNTSGTIPYYCVLHPFMTGTITISDDDPVPEESNQKTKTVVTGYIIITTQPDTLENTIKATYEKIEKVKFILEDAGIDSEKIEPANVSFNPEYYSGQGQGSTFSLYTQFIVKTGLSNVNKVLDAAKNEGAYFESMFLSTSDAVIDKARIELYQLAFTNAQQRAEEIAKPIGLVVGKVKNIEVNLNSLGNPGFGISTYRGVNIVSPDYNSNNQGQMVFVSMTVEFELK